MDPASQAEAKGRATATLFLHSLTAATFGK